MTALEKRLAETERALFFALRELHDGAAVHADYHSQPSYQGMRESVFSNDTPSTQQEKADLMASWASRPLENRTQAQAWLESMRTGPCAADGVHLQTVAHAPATSTAAPISGLGSPAHFATQPESERVGDSESKGNASLEQSQQYKASRRKGKRSRGRASRLSEPYRSPGDGGAVDPPVLAPPPSRASSFANANKEIYF